MAILGIWGSVGVVLFRKSLTFINNVVEWSHNKQQKDNTMSMTGWIVIGVVLVGVLMFGGYAIGTLNKEAGLHMQIEAKQKANTSDFDMMKKTLTQMAEGAKFNFDSLKDIFASHAQARTTDSKNVVMNWIKESIPNVAPDIMNKMMNVIEAKRAEFNMRQKELIDYEREHRLMFNTVPDNIVLAMFGRHQLPDVTIVTSMDTKAAFKTGEDNDTKLFNK